MALNLNVPQMHDEFSPRICVVGVGGAGGNAINNMISSGLEGVEFFACNTDSQDLSQSLTENRVQLGPNTTQGLGAGMQPHVGANAAQESLEEILHHLEGANMVFVTAGMGGGTGTGAAPVIARALRDKNILTVGVVTKPFQFEGMKRAAFAEEGIANMSEAVDTLIVIPNQNLFRLADERTTFADAFKMADNVLLDGVRSVSDLIVKPGIVNLDFADVRTLMTLMGKAMMGTGEGEGDTRALDAANLAIANPLLDDMSLDGAKGVLINVSGGPDVTLYEVDVVANQIRNKVDPDANIIFGSSVEDNMDGAIRVSVVATGIDAENMPGHASAGAPGNVAPAAGGLRGGPGVGPGRGPDGGPGGPGGGPGRGPGGGQPAPQPTPQPAPQQNPPMSPFGRSPFAFRGNNSSGNEGGPTSQLDTSPPQGGETIPASAAPAPAMQSPFATAATPAPAVSSPAIETAPATPRLAAAAAAVEPAPSLSVSPNYQPVPPANAATQRHAAALQTATPGDTTSQGPAAEPSLFSQHAVSSPQQSAPMAQPEAQAQAQETSFPAAPTAPASGQGLGGLFSRFAAAPRQETVPASGPQATPQAFAAAPHSPMGGAAVAAANASMQAYAQAEAQQPAPATLANLDSPAPTGQNVDVHGSANAPRVVDLDDSANSGLESFDQSYKSVPAFLRHQNN